MHRSRPNATSRMAPSSSTPARREKPTVDERYQCRSSRDWRRWVSFARAFIGIDRNPRGSTALVVIIIGCDFPFGAVVKDSISFLRRPRRAMSDWVVHCEVNQRHIRRSHATREAALKDACSQLLQGHAVNRIVGPQKTITGERVRDWCAKHQP